MRPAQIRTGFFLLASAFFLSGCLGGDSGGSSDDRNVGQITPTGISGLTYQTASQRGKTNKKGRYYYYPGERLTLWVGDLEIATDVPVEPDVTPLEFFPDVRDTLKIAGTTPEGLQSHRITEQQLITNSDRLINVTRFLLALNWRMRVNNGEGIDIRDRVIEQLNATLPSLTDPIDFDVPRDEFAFDQEGVLSPANKLLEEICFFPEDDKLCEEPPTQDEIDAAPKIPEDPEEIVPVDDRPDSTDPVFQAPNYLYQEEAETRRKNILDAIRTIGDVKIETVEDYLTRELDILSTELGIKYYLNEFVADYPASDTSIKTVTVKKIAGKPDLADIEAVSTRDNDVVIHSFGWQSASVDYFIAGESGGESEVLVNFKPDDTYRWVKKQLRVIIK